MQLEGCFILCVVAVVLHVPMDSGDAGTRNASREEEEAEEGAEGAATLSGLPDVVPSVVPSGLPDVVPSGVLIECCCCDFVDSGTRDIICVFRAACSTCDNAVWARKGLMAQVCSKSASRS